MNYNHNNNNNHHNMPGGVQHVLPYTEQWESMIAATNVAITRTLGHVYKAIVMSATYQVVNGIIYDVRVLVEYQSGQYGHVNSFRILDKQGRIEVLSHTSN